MDAIEIVTDHALLILGLRAPRFTLFLFFIKNLYSTAVFVTSIEDISNACLPVSRQKHNGKIVMGVGMKEFLTVKLRRGASQQKEGLLLEHAQLNAVKIYGIFKSWNISWYKRSYLQCWSKGSFIQALICLLTVEESQVLFIVDSVVCPLGN